MSARLSILLLAGAAILFMTQCGSDGDRPTEDAGKASAKAPVSPVRLTDVTKAVGIDFVHHKEVTGKKRIYETMGSGAVWLDYDSDGWPDVFFVDGSPEGHCRLYRNDQGRFVDVTEKTGTGVVCRGMGAVAGDYDGDGHVDLYITAFGPNTLLRNRGDGTFEDVTEAAGVGDDAFGSSAAFFDGDGDGDLDLYVVNYLDYGEHNWQKDPCYQKRYPVFCPPSEYEGAFDVYYRNEGGRRFVDGTQEAGFGRAAVENEGHPEAGKGLGVSCADFDDDGDIDLYVANDTTINFLYRNDGGRFVDIAFPAGVGLDTRGVALAGMGVDFGDFDHDQRADLIVTNFQKEPNTLYRNDGEGFFRELSQRLGLRESAFSSLGFGVVFADLDRDGWCDLFVANGHVYDNVEEFDASATSAQLDHLLINHGGERFELMQGESAGDVATIRRVGRGVSVADFDRDGDLDVLVTNCGSAPILYRNDPAKKAHWIALRLVARESANSDAIGARVIVKASGQEQMQERRTGTSYLSQNEGLLFYGLGDATQVDSIRVRWPDGTWQDVENVPLDQITTIEKAE
ncbi:MAG: CRTAC1 family protein [Planctomycetota bacterium]